MSSKNLIVYGVMAALGAGGLALSQGANAGGPFNMMNPSKWFGGNNDRYDDDYYYRDRYYGGGPYGGYGPGWGGYGPYGYGPGWGGYGYGYPPYGYPQQQQTTPAPERVPQ